MEVIEEERQDGRPLLNYTHVIKPGVTQLENYGWGLPLFSTYPIYLYIYSKIPRFICA